MSKESLPKFRGSVQACRRLWVARLGEVQGRLAWLTQTCFQVSQGVNEDITGHGGRLADERLLDLAASVATGLDGFMREGKRLQGELSRAVSVMRREVFGVCRPVRLTTPDEVFAEGALRRARQTADRKAARRACSCRGVSSGRLHLVK